MPLNPYLLLAIVTAFIFNGFYWNAHGSNAADTRWKAQIEKQRADAEGKAREQEHNWQGAIDAITKTQDAKLRNTRALLATALDGLRDRPERPSGVSEAPRAGCEGANGRELSKRDSEVLVRLAARADDIRTGLDTCYQFIDKVK